jgi:hypothetical protein
MLCEIRFSLHKVSFLLRSRIGGVERIQVMIGNLRLRCISSSFFSCLFAGLVCCIGWAMPTSVSAEGFWDYCWETLPAIPAEPLQPISLLCAGRPGNEPVDGRGLRPPRGSNTDWGDTSEPTRPTLGPGQSVRFDTDLTLAPRRLQRSAPAEAACTAAGGRVLVVLNARGRANAVACVVTTGAALINVRRALAALFPPPSPPEDPVCPQCLEPMPPPPLEPLPVGD